MVYQSEYELERRLIRDLIEYNRYQPVQVTDEETLESNFRAQLDAFNQEKLGGVPLSDKEFERVLLFLKGNNVYQCAKILRDKFVLQRDDGSEVYLEFFDSHTLGRNLFQVSSQVTMTGKYTNRYDVTLLVNGLPLVQMELKRRGEDMKVAFFQIERYRKHSYQGLFRFVQIFVISNGVDTKYFANSDGPILYSHAFFWSDDQNHRITSLNDFVDTFLRKDTIAEIIAKYMIINDTDKLLMVMRPYQIFAVKALLEKALNTNKNGYIWHATGSGKTLTSFKASQVLAREPNIRKVFFLVDRKDLDTQTTEEFNKFQADSVDPTDRTATLVRHIQDNDRTLILTTMQKMNRAITSKRYTRIMEAYRDEKVVFIIDECHRSQFGQMHREISRHFRNAQYFGFTGTPIFPENQGGGGMVTADLFDKCLHTYLLKDAIRDNNVLGFSVEYIKTFDIEYDPQETTRVPGIRRGEVWEDQRRIDMIADHVISCHAKKTRNRQYCAIFATPRIDTLIRYYDTFKEKDSGLKIAAIYTYGANEDPEGKSEHSRDTMERIIGDYNELFGTKYSTDTFAGYYRDISRKVKTAQIDILLVVGMFLTGFDSRPLNTLYVDKNLEYHSLLQAFSRTNRVEKDTKPYGNIVCYRNLKEKTDEAICIYSQTDNADLVLRKDYEYYRNEFAALRAQLLGIAANPETVDLLESEEEKGKFVLAFRELSRVLLVLQSFVDFEFTEEELGMSEQTYQDYKSKYLRIYDETKRQEREDVSILADVDFAIEIMQTDRINVAYIMNLIRNIDLADPEGREKDTSHILAELDRTDNPELRLRVDLIRDFLARVVPHLEPDSHIMGEYADFEAKRRREDIEQFARENQLDPGFVREELSEYEYSGILRKNEILSKLEGRPFLVKTRLKQDIIDFIVDQTARYY